MKAFNKDVAKAPSNKEQQFENVYNRVEERVKNTEETADTEKIVLEELEKEFGYITNELEIEYIKSGMKEIEERKKRCEAAKPQIEETTEILKELKKGRRKR